jgi:hypothetical protein
MTAQRERLPNRRANTVFDFEVGGLRYTATLSRFSDGRIAEIFLQNHKPGSQSDATARDAALVASLALQHGCTLDVLRGALLRDVRGKAATPLGVALDLVAEREGSPANEETA